MDYQIEQYVKMGAYLRKKNEQPDIPTPPISVDPLYCKQLFQYGHKPDKLTDDSYSHFLASFVYYLWHIAQIPAKGSTSYYEHLSESDSQQLLALQSLLGRWVVHKGLAIKPEVLTYLESFIQDVSTSGLSPSLLLDIKQVLKQTPENTTETTRTTLVQATLSLSKINVESLSKLLKYLYGKDPVKAALKQSPGELTATHFHNRYPNSDLPSSLTSTESELDEMIDHICLLIIEGQRKGIYSTVDMRKLPIYAPFKATDKPNSARYLLIALALRPIFIHATGDLALTFSYRFKDMYSDEFSYEPIQSLNTLAQCLFARALPLTEADYQFAFDGLMPYWDKEHESNELIGKLLKKLGKQLDKETFTTALSQQLEAISQLPNAEYLSELTDKSIADFMHNSGKEKPREKTVVDDILSIEKYVKFFAKCSCTRPSIDPELDSVRAFYDSRNIEEVSEQVDATIQGLLHLIDLF